MRRVFTVGEALIDFIPHEIGVPLKEVKHFTKMPGGAPANVAATVGKLGGNASFIGKVGKDAFGDFLKDVLQKSGVDTSYMFQSIEANTALAFVSLQEDGEREFSFYRNPSADLLLNKEEVKDIPFFQSDILHFCSVDLIEADVKYAHLALIENMKKAGGTVVFDPNIRENLWPSITDCIKTIQYFLPFADIIKCSEEEIKLIMGEESIDKAVSQLLDNINADLIVTKGKDGAVFYDRNRCVEIPAFPVKVIDTTGAGDAFIGSFIYQLSLHNKSLEEHTENDIRNMLKFSNAVAALVTTKMGAIDSLPTLQEVNHFQKKFKQ